MPSISEDIQTVISTVGTDIKAVVGVAYTQIVSELEVLEQSVLLMIKNDIALILDKVEAGSTVEQIETELLNLWGANKASIISALSSGALQVLITMAKMAVAA